MKKIFCILAFVNCQALFSQDTTVQNQLINHTPNFSKNKSKIFLAGVGSAAAYGSSLFALSNAWYQQYPQTSFHFFNDSKDWLQMDKAGHLFGAYTAGKMSMELWRWAGLNRNQRIWTGGLSGTAYMTVIEILDGLSTGWGFSLYDLSANVMGSSLFIAQELAWQEQRIQVKFSFHRNDYGTMILNQKADLLFGNKVMERMLKDYNGQTYWLSLNLKSFVKQSSLPAWLTIALGYGAEGMFGGTENFLKDVNGTTLFDRRDIPRYRKWYIAPDIDLTKIKTKSRFLKASFFLLNALKFPAPAIELSKKGIEWHWIQF